jgi:hypothetical protein
MLLSVTAHEILADGIPPKIETVKFRVIWIEILPKIETVKFRVIWIVADCVDCAEVSCEIFLVRSPV